MHIGDHRVLCFVLLHLEGERRPSVDEETGRMVVKVITQYLVEHTNDLLCFSHYDTPMAYALFRLFHRWARVHQDVHASIVEWFDGKGQSPDGRGLHFMVMHHTTCDDAAELKSFILEHQDEFASSARKQMNLFTEAAEPFFKKKGQ